MTSTILTPKSNFSTVIKNVTLRNIGSVIFILIVNLLMAVAGVSISVSLYSDQLADFLVNKNFETVDLTMETVAVIGVACVTCGLLSIGIAPNLFREIYSKRACDFYFSAPVKRGTYFTASYLFGAVLNVVSMVIPVAIFVVALKGVNSQVFVFDEKVIATIFCGAVLALLAIYSAFIMCAVTAGRKFQYFLLSLICLFCPAIAISGIDAKLNSIWGYFNEKNIYGFISPPINAANAVFSYDTKYYSFVFIISVVEIIGMFAAGYLVFKNRKAEVAEVSLTGKILPYFLLGLFVLSGFMFTDTVSNNLVTVIVGIIFAVISGLLFSKIFYRKWFTKITAITTGAVCAACVIFVCSIYLPSYDNYVKYIPDADEVESIELTDVYGINENDLVSRLMFMGAYDSDELYIDSDTVTIKSKQGIEDAMNLHKNTVSDDAISNTQHFQLGVDDLLFGTDSYYPTYGYTITYNLKDGNQVKRTYSVGTAYVEDALLQLFRNKEVITQSYYAYSNTDDILLMTSIDNDYNYSYEYYEYDDVITEDITQDDYDYSENYDYSETEKSVMTVDQAIEFIDIYSDDTITVDEDDFRIVLTGMYESILSSVSFTDDYKEPSYNVNIYYIDPSATEEQRKTLKSMTSQEILSLYEKDVYSDNVTQEQRDLFMVLNVSIVNVFDFQGATISYLEQVSKK